MGRRADVGTVRRGWKRGGVTSLSRFPGEAGLRSDPRHAGLAFLGLLQRPERLETAVPRPGDRDRPPGSARSIASPSGVTPAFPTIRRLLRLECGRCDQDAWRERHRGRRSCRKASCCDARCSPARRPFAQQLCAIRTTVARRRHSTPCSRRGLRRGEAMSAPTQGRRPARPVAMAGRGRRAGHLPARSPRVPSARGSGRPKVRAETRSGAGDHSRPDVSRRPCNPLARLGYAVPPRLALVAGRARDFSRRRRRRRARAPGRTPGMRRRSCAPPPPVPARAGPLPR